MILYDESECLFDTNGYGRLEEAIRATAIEEQNGEYTLEVEYPISGKRYSVIKTGMIILARHEDSSDMQPFRIYRISRPLSGRVTIYARHVSYDLANVPMLPFTALTAKSAMGKLQTNPNFGSPFSFWTDIEDDTPFTMLAPASVRQVLGGAEESILAQYGGEYKFDKYAVRLYAHRGEDNGVSIRYGKNLTELLRDTDTDGRYSAVMPYYNNIETGELITLPELTLPLSGAPTFSGDYQDQTGTDYDNGAEDYTGITSETRVLALDISESFWTAPTVAELRAEARKKIKGMGAGPLDSLRVSFINLWDTQEYKNYAPLQNVRMGDTVHVYYSALGVNVTMRVVRTVYDLINERYDSIELGTPAYNMNNAVSAITTVTASAEARNAIAKASKASLSMIDQQTQIISGQTGGNFVIDKDASGRPIGWLIMDTADKATARNVLRANLSGIGFSPNGYNGPFTTAWTIDGKFNADFIQTGALNADLITTGSMSADRITSGTMDANLIKAGVLTDAAGNFSLDMTTGALTMQNGFFYGTVGSGNIANWGSVYLQDGKIITYEDTGQTNTLNTEEVAYYGTPYDDYFIVNRAGSDLAGYAWYFGRNEILTLARVGPLYQTPTLQMDGDLHITGKLRGSKAETVSGSYNGLTITLYKNAGAVTCYIRGTTTAEFATGNGYVDLFEPLNSSWMPAAQLISYQLLTNAPYRGQIVATPTKVRLGYTRNNANTQVNLPSGSNVYVYVTWAAK